MRVFLPQWPLAVQMAVALLLVYVAHGWLTIALLRYGAALWPTPPGRARVAAWREGWGLAGVMLAAALPAWWAASDGEAVLPVPVEQAQVDGANRWQVFLYLTIPMMMPVLLTVLFIRLMDALRVVDEVFMLTSGGPGTATQFIGIFIYRVVVPKTEDEVDGLMERLAREAAREEAPPEPDAPRPPQPTLLLRWGSRLVPLTPDEFDELEFAHGSEPPRARGIRPERNRRGAHARRSSSRLP